MISKELFRIASTLDDINQLDAPELDRLIAIAESFGKAWSGSWLGYQSRVYYKNFEVPPAGAVFSQEWGFQAFSAGSKGEWREFRFDDVISLIESKAQNPSLDDYYKKSKEVAEKFDEARLSVLSLIHAKLKIDDDKFLNGLIEKVGATKIVDESDIVGFWRPTGQVISRDMIAIEKGLVVPPHVSVLANVHAIKFPYGACKELHKLIITIANHMKNIESKEIREARLGTNVFIGHGRSPYWRELKDFVDGRLGLPWDEFNRVPVAGVTNITRLSQMLDQACFAFLLMTAEDEQADGNLHARMNVIHEVGLFQGRLGFEKAIVLLEEGCQEFSNINGLGQIRFPKGNISAIFEDIRAVLERENLIA